MLTLMLSLMLTYKIGIFNRRLVTVDVNKLRLFSLLFYCSLVLIKFSLTNYLIQTPKNNKIS